MTNRVETIAFGQTFAIDFDDHPASVTEAHGTAARLAASNDQTERQAGLALLNQLRGMTKAKGVGQ
ncbi:MAG: hypothetical protein JWO31_381 [Phycisphaerales bacterium]|nr:hypothetical protein [Phycisphaerales bacterium]